MHRQLEDIFHHFSVVRNGERIIPHGRIKWLYEQVVRLQKENQQLQEFYDYFANLHGKGLEVANYHLNGDTEPFDNFFDEAEEALKGETK